MNPTKAAQFLAVASTIAATKNLTDFRRGLHAAIRGYWKGDMDFGTAVNSFMSSIDRGFTRAWRLGAAEFGITPADYSEAEQSTLRQRINEQDPYVMALFGRLIPKARGGLMRDALKEAELFVARFEDVRGQARVMAARDAPMEWTVGVAEHCNTCINKLNGKVKRASWWVSNGILPRRAGAWYLECGGYK